MSVNSASIHFDLFVSGFLPQMIFPEAFWLAGTNFKRICSGFAVLGVMVLYITKIHFWFFFYFTADLTDYSTEMTGSKGLSTKDNMLDLFEILRGHYSPAGSKKRIPLLLFLLFVSLLTGQMYMKCIYEISWQKLLASISKLCNTEKSHSHSNILF